MRKSLRHILTVLLLLAAGVTFGQELDSIWSVGQKENDVMLETRPQDVTLLRPTKSETYRFDRLWGAVTVGTTGFGFDLATPISEMVHLRAGFAIMPSLKTDMTFSIRVGESDPKYDKNGNRIETKFEKLANAFQQVTGKEIRENVNMIGRPTFYNAKLLVDVFPFHNKKWFLTGGIYYGNEQIAKAYNSTEDMNVLYSVSLYNSLHGKVIEAVEDPWNIDNEVVIMEYGNAAIVLPQEQTEYLYKYMKRYGRMGIHLGDYYLEPDEDNMVRCSVKANRLKPYLGFGYGNATPQGDKRVAFSLEAGLMMWGGTPRVDCYGTDLVDMNVKGRVGHYIDFFKAMKAYPVVNLRVACRLF
ncbi:MAG: hypothetical protein K5893_01860 [Prevotella sp.]|nr:hypothetical protein [Prevotella sp.]